MHEATIQRAVPMRALGLLTAAALGLLSGCAGDGTRSGGQSNVLERTATTSTTSGARTTSSGGGALDSIAIPEVAGRDERMQIGMDATRKLDDFVSSDRTVIGERTVVDLSRTPFLAMSAFALNRDDIERVDSRDHARGLMIITLRNRTGVKTVYSGLPKVEIGGLIFIGVEQLQLRYAMRTDAARPIHLSAIASGNAVYRAGSSDSSRRGRQVSLTMEIRGTGDDARFDEQVGVSR